MISLWNYLKQYLTDHFHLGLYAIVFIFLAITTYLNFKLDFENSVVDAYHQTWKHWPIMSLFMAFPFLTICCLLSAFGVNKDWWKSREFWLLFIIGFALLGFSRTFYLHYALIDHLDPVDYKFARKVLWRAKSFFILFIPLILFYIIYERKKDESNCWYGLTLNKTEFKPYAILLLVVVAGIALASFLSDLTAYYPRYLVSGGSAFAVKHNINEWYAMLLYETVYGANFLNVELFFRGFLVIGFARVLGGQVVLAMVGSYVFLHYGKPMPEAISSAFGGYFIGILAFYSRRIWGGVILHVALAWSMEFFAWLQRLYN